MIHKACMPVYMNSGKIVADGRDGTGKSKVLQEVLADLKSRNHFRVKPSCSTIMAPGLRGYFGEESSSNGELLSFVSFSS